MKLPSSPVSDAFASLGATTRMIETLTGSNSIAAQLKALRGDSLGGHATRNYAIGDTLALSSIRQHALMQDLLGKSSPWSDANGQASNLARIAGASRLIEQSGLAALLKRGNVGQAAATLGALTPPSALFETVTARLPSLDSMYSPPMLIGKLLAAAQPFGALRGTLAISSVLADSLAALKAAQQVMPRLQLPVIDATSAGVIAEVWGDDGFRQQLQALGIEFGGDEQEGQTAIPPLSAEPRSPRAAPDMYTLLGILLALVCFLYDIVDGAQSDALLAKLDRNDERQQRALRELAARVEDSIAQHVPNPAHQFVARDRAALVRSEPKTGADIVGRVFPRQPVVATGERGKWIEVEYYDFLRQDIQTGWVLKKYFRRVKPATPVIDARPSSD